MTAKVSPDAEACVAVYARVSTTRQAEADLSIPDQLASAKAYCARHGWSVVAEFIEPGASGTDDSRPEFVRLMQMATDRSRPFDIVLVHSLSRFARDLVTLELSAQRLRKNGARLVSMTQETSDDANGDLMRRIIAAIDEHHSRENAKHTHRAMRENARQGFWNGSRAPFGYRTAEAGRRGHRIKKVLVIEETEAALVRRIFAMHLGAEGGPIGVKAIAAKLNVEGARFRGKPFSISNVHRILTAETYAGRHWFDRVDSRTGQGKARDQWIASDVPALVSAEQFEQVRESLASRAPARCPPRTVTSPVLLTGIAVCGSCGSGMTLRTGKSGRYRYYTCAACAHRGKACSGRSMPMDHLDSLVLGAFAEQVLKPHRLAAILADYVAQSLEADARRRERLGRARKELTEAEGGKSRLMALVARGVLDPDDPQLVAQLREAETRRRQAAEEVTLIEGQASRAGPKTITPAKVERLGQAIQEALQYGPLEFRRAYLRLFVGKVTVGDEEISVSGPISELARATASGAEEAVGTGGSTFIAGGVPNGIRTRVTNVKGWCPRPLDDGDQAKPKPRRQAGRLGGVAG